jgi:thiamine kinase-like enzyme
MSDASLETVPPARRYIIRSAIRAAFGGVPIDTIAPVPGGVTMASLFRFEAGNRPYLVRVEGQPGPLRNPHQYVSLRIAAEAGIAPRVLHLDESRGVAIMEYIERQPLRNYPGGRSELARAMGELLRRIQETPAFPHFMDYPYLLARLLAHLRRTGLFAPGLLDAHGERLARICQTEPWTGAGLVSSHNDPHPRNILFDGERLWLVDWESAYRNDPLVDVAILLDNLASEPAVERLLLRAWLGRAPDGALLDRLAAIRSLTRLFYAGVLLSMSAAAAPLKPDGDLSAPSRPDFERAIREGRLSYDAPETRHILGKIYLASFLSGDSVPPLVAPWMKEFLGREARE